MTQVSASLLNSQIVLRGLTNASAHQAGHATNHAPRHTETASERAQRIMFEGPSGEYGAHLRASPETVVPKWAASCGEFAGAGAAETSAMRRLNPSESAQVDVLIAFGAPRDRRGRRAERQLPRAGLGGDRGGLVGRGDVLGRAVVILGDVMLQGDIDRSSAAFLRCDELVHAIAGVHDASPASMAHASKVGWM